MRNRHLEITAGISARDYAGEEGTDLIGLALNRSVPVYDPSQGPLDVYAELESFNKRIHVSFPVSVDYVFKTGNRTQLKIGLMHNIAIKPLAESELTVIMYKKEYKGKFSPRTSFWGANVAFDVNFSKKLKERIARDQTPKDVTNSYRKSIFIERHGSGVFLSGNYDTRIKKDVNNGFGVKAGIGIGDYYLTTVTNNNKPTSRRSLTLPLGVNYIIGKKKHGLEAGVGFTPQFALDDIREGFTGVKNKFPYHIGYRFQPKKEGLVARVAWSPVMDKLSGWNNFKYISYNTGISIGYSFK